ncbi:RagB/SusD family nutrient uptake outer membrane protein [Fibrivirga algicola]|uniref:RagB/SusD family nutrient uptake outer membrane protein n=1 Tax=Fibrivirga algicola TaxID=2950420 RepID=A0ABX0QCD2_9BACT|nr:RagB/SusD family nutrient uptake outer membrane protein [Fibrivirga algicola]ARK10735.1 RagB/SusD family protein [Fibrella sp. ES10-3-2-2]NID10044.1 RagB/SusD family nutrient uptake outer membrane protein [Fibrivirga algicola]
MKLLVKKKIGIAGLVTCLLAGVSACTNLIDVDPKDALSSEQVYRNVFDADAAVLGVYGKFMTLAKQYVVLNELRADLMDVTAGADEQLRQINNHDVVAGNAYADPRPYYEVILNCNDILKNFKIMLQQNKMRVDEYNQRAADITALRSWVYLQLGIHFGSVPYVTEAYENVTDLAAVSSVPKMELTALIKELITTMEAIPSVYREPYTSNTSIVAAPVDGYPLNKFFINKHVLLGDLYLWDNQYLKAAQTYKLVMETAARTGVDPNSEAFYATYKIHYAGTNNNDFSVGYLDGVSSINRLADANTLGWRSMFARRSTENWFNYEWIWFMPFDKNFKPENPFVDLFSNINGRYQLAPAQQAIDLWNSQKQTNNFPFDARGRLTYKTVAGSPVIMKYLYNYLDPNTGLPIGATLQEKNGNWFLYRAATLHLRFAEAANRNGRRKLAYALLNNGISTTFDSDPVGRDETFQQSTFDVAPYDFFARNGDVPLFRDPWYRNNGIRGRANLQNVPVVGDSTVSIENSLIEESALELAYEGQRWPDLVRVALRRNDPAFLADKVYQKLRKANNPNAEAVRTKLMDKNNWFLPFKMK